jgi:hypothetical protein
LSNAVKREIEILKRINNLPAPRDLNPLPEWADPHIIESLMAIGYLACFDFQRDESGIIYVMLRTELTASGRQFLDSKLKPDWKRLASIATIMAIVVAWLIFLVQHFFSHP